MHFGNILTADSANGPGIRLSLFVSGCTNHCKGCFQPETWDFEYGKLYTQDTENYIISELSKPYYQGLTILGGDPMEFDNQKALLPLIKRVKTELLNKDIWIYTGFLYEDLLSGGRRYIKRITDEFIKNIDVIVDGPFELDKKNITLEFRGSSNQRIIYL